MRILTPLIVCCLALSAGAKTPAAERVRKVGSLDHPTITESSGITASRKYAGVFWTHNDKNNLPALFAVDKTGKLLAEFRVSANNDDWEDIATDDAGNLYLARIGNNDARMDEVAVYRIPEPDMERKRTRPGRAAPNRSWRIKYPGRPFDAESLFIHKDFGYLLDKRNDDRKATLYRFPLSETQDEVMLEAVTTVPITAPVTAASISSDARRLAVLTTDGLFLFAIDGDPARASSVEPDFIKLKNSNIEGCSFTDDGVLVTAESREVFLFTDAAPPKQD